MLYTKFFTVFVFITLFSCGSNMEDSTMKTFTGVIKKTEITAYQYGTHTLETEDTFYALRSDSVNLDDYVGKKVSLLANPVEGYPVENGPVYLDVVKIK